MIKVTKLNRNLLLVLAVVLFLCVEFHISSETELSGGNYGRYLDSLWARQIVSSGRIGQNPFPTAPSLFSNANGYAFNLMPAATLALLNILAGFDVLQAQITPLYGVLFLLSVFLAASALYRGRPLMAILTVALSCFFVYTVNQDAREVNRIILFYGLLNLFLYSFIISRTRPSISVKALELFFAVSAIFAYSSSAVSAIVFVGLLSLADAYRTRRPLASGTGMIYGAACLSYYLLVTGFLVGGLAAFKQVLDTRGFSFETWLFTAPGVWPAQLVYVPSYSAVDWFFLLYPFAVLGVLLAVSTYLRIRRWRRERYIEVYDEVLVSFIGFMAFVVIFNSLALFPSAGLDYISIFGLLAPILCVYPFSVFFKRAADDDTINSTVGGERERSDSQQVGRRLDVRSPFLGKETIAVCVVALALVTGTIGIFHYSDLGPRVGEQVGSAEISAAKWLLGKDVVVSSDLHFVSTYVTLGGTSARHFLPMDANLSAIRAIYYDANTSFLAAKGVTVFVVTRSMESSYITHFVGTRTLPNRELSAEYGAQWNAIYDNGLQTIFSAP